MKKKFVATLAVLAASSVGANAFSLLLDGWGFTDPASGFVNSAGALTDGITVQVVTFATDPAPIADDLAALQAAANVHFEDTSGTVFGISPASVSNQTTENVSGIMDDPLYLFAFLGTEWFLGTSTEANWVGGLDDPLSPTVNLGTQQVDVVHWGDINTSDLTGPAGAPDGNPDRLIQLAPIPEPSTYALMLAGIAGMFIYFRRRK